MEKKKNSPVNKHDDDVRLAAFNLFCDGSSVTEAALTVGVNKKTVSGWKRAKWPEDWILAKQRRLAAKTKILEEESLDRVGAMHRRQQKRFQSVLDITAAAIAHKMNKGNFNDEVAADILFKASDAERKLYISPEIVYAPKPSGVQVGTGAFAKPTGEIGVLTVLNQMWEEGNIGKPADTVTVEPSSHPTDVRKIS